MANNVFPVPGGPESKTPFGILAPNFVNFSGYFKNSTISTSSPLASSTPATWSNLILWTPSEEAFVAPKALVIFLNELPC